MENAIKSLGLHHTILSWPSNNRNVYLQCTQNLLGCSNEIRDVMRYPIAMFFFPKMGCPKVSFSKKLLENVRSISISSFWDSHDTQYPVASRIFDVVNIQCFVSSLFPHIPSVSKMIFSHQAVFFGSTCIQCISWLSMTASKRFRKMKIMAVMAVVCSLLECWKTISKR